MKKQVLIFSLLISILSCQYSFAQTFTNLGAKWNVAKTYPAAD